MKPFMLRFYLFLLLLIHTADMVLTEHYIGNNWQRESFYPMSMTIKYIGISNACWVSRVCMYGLAFWMLLNEEKSWMNKFALVITILYYAAMVCWMFTLGYWHFPG